MGYRFKCEIVDDETDEVVIADYCTLLGTIDQFGGCETVDMHVASMLRAFQRTARPQHEAKNIEVVEEA